MIPYISYEMAMALSVRPETSEQEVYVSDERSLLKSEEPKKLQTSRKFYILRQPDRLFVIVSMITRWLL
jgi:hypothetical protein